MHPNRKNLSRPPPRRQYHRNKPPILLHRERKLSDPTATENSTFPKSEALPPISSHNLSLNNSQMNAEKQILNIEHVLSIEKKLWGILENLRKGIGNKQLCEEYWEITEDSNLVNLIKLFRDPKQKQFIQKALVIEATSIAFCNFCFSGDPQPDLLITVRNLIYYIHQNFLNLLRLLLTRVSISSKNNTWVENIIQTIEEKSNKLQNTTNCGKFLQEQTGIICNILSSLTKLIVTPVNQVIYSVLESLDNLTVHKARLMLERVQIDTPFVPLAETILKVVPAPYLPPLTEEKYTLVLDLDETLIHYMEIGNEGRLFVRPNCQKFLEEMNKYYEVVIFTAALQEYADWALDQIDKGNWIHYRLYRQHTMPSGNVFIKDLSRLGRDLTRTIIVDNVADNFMLQNDNGIFVKTWFDDASDMMLESLAPLLKEIVNRQVKDVRIALRNYRDQYLRQIMQGVQNPLSNLSFKR